MRADLVDFVVLTIDADLVSLFTLDRTGGQVPESLTVFFVVDISARQLGRVDKAPKGYLVHISATSD